MSFEGCEFCGNEVGKRTRTELDDPAPRTVLMPIGSLEQRGPHLPLDTDTRIAVAVTRRPAEVTRR